MFESLGGRKFVMTVLIMAAGVAVEVHAPTGMSVTMAGFLASILATFSATNAIISTRSIKADGQKTETSTSTDSSPEAIAKMDTLLNNQILLNQGLSEVLGRQETSDKALQTLQTSTASVQKTLVAFLSSNRQG